ncbi:hypothetical protein M231_02851 [Tremella mesenterica]|uniref:Alpha/beta hydrolase fold-3 domain-containing protein n=1 Tax=Tremella mesenterica TaxID=5217 RepID=A0A4V1M4C8_TREME|nr:hypothetical protein M231_02851 [Tremella mesenterica]
MLDLLTPQALATVGPLLLETFLKHYLAPSRVKNKAREDDILYDEAFVLIKTFLEISTHHPVAALQRFGLVRTPSPPWVAVHRVLIPDQCLQQSAQNLITAFGGEQMAYKIAGGSKWWQVRAGPGVQAEWIVMKKDWKELREQEKKEQSAQYAARKAGLLMTDESGSSDGGEFRKEMDELRCMLYSQWFLYYWGSINTYRYTIWRYARKMHGRCFAVNYRKAPQYPFPCAIQDCLAAYLYLTNPPPGAKHKPVDPKNMVIAGDSAGGGLVLALLQILRDTPGLPLPAGAVLISPVSIFSTHTYVERSDTFLSVDLGEYGNGESNPPQLQSLPISYKLHIDIVPPYSFIHKPSSLWPPPPPDLTADVQSRLRTRIQEAVHRLRHDSHPSTQPSSSLSSDVVPRGKIDTQELVKGKTDSDTPDKTEIRASEPEKTSSVPHTKVGVVRENEHPFPQGEPSHHPSRANPAVMFKHLQDIDKSDKTPTRTTTLAQCHEPLNMTVEGKEVKLDTQIQMYATNAQLCHPWVSPVLGYMGGLPPLYICCGQNEVLRDEIIYLAHKAANPSAYPIRPDVRAMLPSLIDIESKHPPTNVHLQVYDGACHDLPLFSMTKSARGVFRAIASFCRFCTPSAPGSLNVTKIEPSQHQSGQTTPIASEMSRPSSRNHTRPSSHHSSSSSLHEDSRINSSPIHINTEPSTEDSRLPSALPSSIMTPTIVSTPTTFSPIDSTDFPARSTPHNSDSPFKHNNIFRNLTHRTRPFMSQPNSKEPYFGGQNNDPMQLPTKQPPKVVSGDDAGPRFDHDRSYQSDSKALPGTAGHPSIYSGPVPFGEIHMIRERVTTTGVCRPLESPSELGALTMPEDEIGMLKEGPVMRFLNGQALWDKRYKRTIRKVAKTRKRNLELAKNKDAGKLGRVWQEKLRIASGKVSKSSRRGKESRGRKAGEFKREIDVRPGDKTVNEGLQSRLGPPADRVNVEGPQEVDGIEGSLGSVSGEQDHSDGETSEEEDGWKDELLDKSWSWKWALEGEAPPPSAIVSRRDFGEARSLALMADRMETSQSGLNGLSIWVGLASFFSSSSERGKTAENLKMARESMQEDKKKSMQRRRSGQHELRSPIQQRSTLADEAAVLQRSRSRSPEKRVEERSDRSRSAGKRRLSLNLRLGRSRSLRNTPESVGEEDKESGRTDDVQDTSPARDKGENEVSKGPESGSIIDIVDGSEGTGRQGVIQMEGGPTTSNSPGHNVVRSKPITLSGSIDTSPTADNKVDIPEPTIGTFGNDPHFKTPEVHPRTNSDDETRHISCLSTPAVTKNTDEILLSSETGTPGDLPSTEERFDQQEKQAQSSETIQTPLARKGQVESTSPTLVGSDLKNETVTPPLETQVDEGPSGIQSVEVGTEGGLKRVWKKVGLVLRMRKG